MNEGFALWVLFSIAGFTDLRYGKIYNKLTFPFCLSGIVYQTWLYGFPGTESALLSVGVAFLIFFPLYFLQVFAAGDVKLLMAAGAWAPYALVLELAFFSTVIAAAVGLVTLLQLRGVRGGAASLLEHLAFLTVPKVNHRSLYIPFAPGLLCAWCVVKTLEIYRWTW